MKTSAVPETPSKVSLVKCPDYRPENLKTAVLAGLNLIGGAGKFVRRGTRVFLKPNVMMPKPRGFAANTHPEFVRAVVELLKDEGAEITIGESSAGSLAGLTFTAKALRASGIEAVAKETGARLANLDLDPAAKIPLRNPFADEIPIAKSVLEADLVVALPKLKTHTYGNIITGAVKLFYGTIPGQVKAEFHRRAPEPGQFYTIVRDLYGVIRPGLTIFDAVHAMEGDGPSAGRERPAGFIITSADGVAADAVASALIGVPPMKVLTTRLSAEARLGNGRMEDIEVVGESLDESVLGDFKLPASRVTNPYLYRLIIGLTKTEPSINRSLCKLCSVCADSCPMKAMSVRGEKMTIDRKACIRCFCCGEVCPSQAIRPRRKTPLGNILSRVISSRW